MEKLYENIRRRRKELRMSQAELAEVLGYSDRSAIARIERGLADLPFSKILKMAEVLEIDPVILMGLDTTQAALDELESLTAALRARKGAKDGAL